MRFARKVAVAVNLNHEIPDVFKTLKDLEFLNQCEIHLVHSFFTINYLVGLGEAALAYPLEADRIKIQESVMATLDNHARKIFPSDFKGKVITHCLFSDDPKRKFCDYVKAEHIDLVIVAAREKKGFFDSSFTYYVQKHTPANMIVLKQKV